MDSEEINSVAICDGSHQYIDWTIKVCDVLVSNGADNNRLKKIPQVATSVIANYPEELNKIRDVTSLYTVLDANKLMRDNNQLRNNFEFTEELPYGEGVFAQISRDRLKQKINDLSYTEENFLSIYTCEPFSLLVGCIDRRLFILDTHPVPEVCGGDGNGLFKLYESASPVCCRSLCQWLWKRLANGGVRSSGSQSLAVVKLFVNEEKHLNDHGKRNNRKQPEEAEDIEVVQSKSPRIEKNAGEDESGKKKAKSTQTCLVKLEMGRQVIV
ncbi:hypothetical protein OS493_022514 [Desmophyllum pertusum]|uniref:Uncharacterized protein n=1 Tax=Desmophyllum pertusum TaxID=174260 RepID=A0A9W9ZBQ0_9CNID|nr:hypothetical protein OS493_022514 [Desmophyllum pertusum]